jgi:hypothetical protein
MALMIKFAEGWALIKAGTLNNHLVRLAKIA